jgi:hypothetical protein
MMTEPTRPHSRDHASDAILQRSLYWDDKDDPLPDNLGALVGPFHVSFANAVNNVSPRRAVGQNKSDQRAVLWERKPNWQDINLTDEINLTACNWLSLNEATDIMAVILGGNTCGDWNRRLGQT